VTWRKVGQVIGASCPVAGASEDQKTLCLLDHPPIHPDRCLSRRHGRRQVSWLADRRLALPSRRHAPPVAYLDKTSRSQLRGQLRNRPVLARRLTAFPFRPLSEGPSWASLSGQPGQFVNGRSRVWARPCFVWAHELARHERPTERPILWRLRFADCGFCFARLAHSVPPGKKLSGKAVKLRSFGFARGSGACLFLAL